MRIVGNNIVPRTRRYIKKVDFCILCFKSHSDLELIEITTCDLHNSEIGCQNDPFDEWTTSFYYFCPEMLGLVFIIGGYIEGTPLNEDLRRAEKQVKKLLPNNVTFYEG